MLNLRGGLQARPALANQGENERVEVGYADDGLAAGLRCLRENSTRYLTAFSRGHFSPLARVGVGSAYHFGNTPFQK